MQKKLLFFLVIMASIASNYGMEKKNKNKGKIKQKFGNVINEVKSLFFNKNNNDLQDDNCLGVLPLELYDLIKNFIILTTFNDGLSIVKTLETISSFELTCKTFKLLIDSSDIESMIKERMGSVLDLDDFFEAISIIKKRRSKSGKNSKLLIPQRLHGYLNNLFNNVQKMHKVKDGLRTLQQETQTVFALFNCGLRPDLIVYKCWHGRKIPRFLFSYIYAPRDNKRVLKILKKHTDISKKCINTISSTAFYDLKEHQFSLEKELLIQFIMQGLNPNYQFRIGYEEKAPLLAISMELFPDDLGLITLLLEKGADPNFRFLESYEYELGYTTPFLLAQGKYPEILQLFQEHEKK